MSLITEHPTKITGSLVAGLGFIQGYPGLPDLLGEQAYGWAMFVVGLLIVVLGFWNTKKADDANKLVIPPSSPLLVGLFVLLVCLSGCVTRPLQPTQTACARGETFSEMRCVATIAEEYEIYQKRGLAIIQDAGTPADVTERIRRADAALTPVVVEMLRAARVYNSAKLQVAAGATEAEKLEIANRELLNWINQAEPILVRLIEAVSG